MGLRRLRDRIIKRRKVMNKDTEQELKELKALTMNIFGRIEKIIKDEAIRGYEKGKVKAKTVLEAFDFDPNQKIERERVKSDGDQTYISDVKSPFKSKGVKSNKVTVFTRTKEGYPSVSFNYDILENGDIVAYSPSIAWIRAKILEVKNNIGSVWFIKKSNGELRKMTYRLHVKNPSVAKKPSGLNTGDRKEIDARNDNLTVFDCNAVVRDNSGNKIGRGAWKTIPLENVVRIKSNGRTFEIQGIEQELSM
jgi:hypothetical protein